MTRLPHGMKDDSLFSLQPGDYMKINSGVYRVIKETTNETVSFIHIDQAISRTKEVVYDSKKFFEDMAYFGIAKKDGSIFDVGFKFGLPKTINETYTVESNINQFNTGITFHSSARYTTTTSREEVIKRIIKGFYVPQFNSKKN